MATTRVNKKNFGSNGGSYSFDGGICDCVIAKNIGNSAGVTYGGISMTKLIEVTDGNGEVHQIWGLQDAPQGVQTISGLSTKNSVESYSGINKTATFPNTSGSAEHHFNSGSQTDIQVDLTTTEDDCILVGLGTYRGGGITFMFTNGGTTLISVDPSGGGENLSLESNALQIGAAGNYSMHTATGGGNTVFAISLCVAALTPGPAAVPVATNKGNMLLLF